MACSAAAADACMWRFLIAVLFCSLSARALTPAQVVVVYNAESKRSEQCARAYCAKRSIPATQCIALNGLPKEQDVSRLVFDTKLRYPILLHARQHSWRLPATQQQGIKPVYAMVLMPDIPLRVREEQEPGKKQGLLFMNRASVDSELALLGANYATAGPLNNPFFNKNAALEEARPPVLAVTRIDAPDDASIRRMIQFPAEVERRGLWGWSVVDQGGPYPQGDEWFSSIARMARENGQPLFHEESKATLAGTFPLMSDTAVYFGWYAHPANGPFNPKTAAAFRFTPGAVAYHLHSYSGTSVKSPDTWVGALLQRGAAVTAGNVYEPTLGGCLKADVFFDRLLKGYTVAEAALMATPWISWQGVVLGDPLYRPYEVLRRNGGSSDNPFVQWRRILLQSVGNRGALVAAARQHGAQLTEMLAWHFAGLGELTEAAEYFGQVARLAQNERNRVRASLLQASLAFLNKDERYGRELMQRLLEQTTRSPFRPAVQKTAETFMPELRPAPKPKPEQKKK